MTIRDFNNALRRINRLLSSPQRRVLVPATKELNNDIKSRIFVEGKDADEGRIGSYKSKSWIRKRVKKQLQVGFVDLKYTGSLSNSLKVISKNKNVTIETDNPVGQYQEERRKKTIFAASEDEVDDLTTYIEILFEQEIEKILQ
jgi:hypothetical protein